jgi:hypothetical protein
VPSARQAQPASRGGWPWSPPSPAVSDVCPSQADLSQSIAGIIGFPSFREILSRTPSIIRARSGHVLALCDQCRVFPDSLEDYVWASLPLQSFEDVTLRVL